MHSILFKFLFLGVALILGIGAVLLMSLRTPTISVPLPKGETLVFSKLDLRITAQRDNVREFYAYANLLDQHGQRLSLDYNAHVTAAVNTNIPNVARQNFFLNKPPCTNNPTSTPRIVCPKFLSAPHLQVLQSKALEYIDPKGEYFMTVTVAYGGNAITKGVRFMGSELLAMQTITD